MGDIEIAVKSAQKLEALLSERFGASGRGLHEKLSSVEEQLPRELIRRIRWIATVRNEVVHEASSIRDAREFKRAVSQSAEQLSSIPPARSGRDSRRSSDRKPRAASRRKRSPRGRAWSGLVSILVLGMIGIAAWWWWRSWV